MTRNRWMLGFLGLLGIKGIIGLVNGNFLEALWILWFVWFFHFMPKRRSYSKVKILYWLPRILSILFIAFVSIFALDVLGEPQWFLALLIHLIPSYILIILTAIAWKHELIGGILFIIAGFLGMLFFHLEAFIIYVPAFIIGILYLIARSGRYRQGSLKSLEM